MSLYAGQPNYFDTDPFATSSNPDNVLIKPTTPTDWSGTLDDFLGFGKKAVGIYNDIKNGNKASGGTVVVPAPTVKQTNYTPWLIGGAVVLTLFLVLRKG